MEVVTKFKVGDLVGTEDASVIGKIQRIEVTFDKYGPNVIYTVNQSRVLECKLVKYEKVA